MCPAWGSSHMESIPAADREYPVLSVSVLTATPHISAALCVLKPVAVNQLESPYVRKPSI